MTKEKPLKEMNVEELKARLASIEEMSPHYYQQLQAWRNTQKRLMDMKAGNA